MSECCICEKKEEYPNDYYINVKERELMKKEILSNGEVNMMVKMGQPILNRMFSVSYCFINSVNSIITENKDLIERYEWYRKKEERNEKSYICEKCIEEMINRGELMREDKKPNKKCSICEKICHDDDEFGTSSIEVKEEILKKTYMPDGKVELMIRMKEPELGCGFGSKFDETEFYFIDSLSKKIPYKELIEKYEWYRKNEEKDEESYVCDECIERMIINKEIIDKKIIKMGKNYAPI